MRSPRALPAAYFERNDVIIICETVHWIALQLACIDHKLLADLCSTQALTAEWPGSEHHALLAAEPTDLSSRCAIGMATSVDGSMLKIRFQE